MTARNRVAKVAVPVPIRRAFDYSLPLEEPIPARGVRVRVPFGRRRSLIGIVTGVADESEVPASRLKAITGILDSEPLLPASLLELLEWAAAYYHHPVGEVIASALPTRLRTQELAKSRTRTKWLVTDSGAAADPQAVKRSALQRRILQALQGEPAGIDSRALAGLSARWRVAVDSLVNRGWVTAREYEDDVAPDVPPTSAPALTAAQSQAVDAVSAASGFKPFLIYGVTGSGKTEVYLRVIEQVLARGAQVLVLVPEIALTPQLVSRFRSRVRVPLVVLHSDLTDQERAHGWLMARAGKARIVVGTRSAVFTPLPHLGLIIVDEEHDPSYKQQDGFRYSARDVAVMRAHREAVPIMLGSATPSLETVNRVRAGHYTMLTLPDRAGGAALPAIEVLDLRRLAAEQGISHPLRVAIADTLQRGEQALLFLNRRGFAPVWMCFQCGWVAPCERCDARLTFHRSSARLRCHHCGAERSLPTVCPACQRAELHALGEGTERIESVLKRSFPTARIVRVDRDSTRAKGSLDEKLERARRGEADILIGTQMLSKGHDFPGVTLVGILNADQGLYGSDFRATERLVQQIIQVSGRAGRGAKPGRVLIQTYHPGHPVFAQLKTAGAYDNFVDYALTERLETGYPPSTHLALLRAESPKADVALGFLRIAHALALRCADSEVAVFDPVPSPMERRAGRYRAQLLVQSAKRSSLHAMLSQWLERLAEKKAGARVRWSLDVDPIDLY